MVDTEPELGTSVLSDTELLEKAMNAKNGRKFLLLYEQGWDADGIQKLYECRRFAELALIVHLTWWSRHDEDQVRRLFAKSAFAESAECPEYLPDLVQSAQSLLGNESYDPNFKSDERRETIQVG